MKRDYHNKSDLNKMNSKEVFTSYQRDYTSHRKIVYILLSSYIH